MACIQHYIKDAENIFQEIDSRQKYAQINATIEYRAARTIQRWFRGFITRKYLKHLNKCATTIQRYWRGYVDRTLYFKLLQETVHKLYWDHYNLMATRIQKVWRGHYIRTKVFSYYKLKQFIAGVLTKNREFQEQAKRYQEHTERAQNNKTQQECQECLQYLSFRVHHLIRTHQIEGIHSIHGTHEYSTLEKVLKNVKFTDYINMKRFKEKVEGKQAVPKENVIFTGRMRVCEKAWLHRNDPGKYSLATGEFGQDLKEFEKQERLKDQELRVQTKPMSFGLVRHKLLPDKLDITTFTCPPYHTTLKTSS